MVPVRRTTTEITVRTGITAGLAAVRQQDGEPAYRIPPVWLLSAPRTLVVRRYQLTAMCIQDETCLAWTAYPPPYSIAFGPIWDWLNPNGNT